MIRILQVQARSKKKWKAALLLVAAAAQIAFVVVLQLSSYVNNDSPYFLRVEVAQTEAEGAELHLPATLDLQSQRALSLNLGGGNCRWQPPVYTVPEEIDFYKTVSRSKY